MPRVGRVRVASGCGGGVVSGWVVRTAVVDDRDAIRSVVREAFDSMDEVELVERVWSSPWYLPDLELVAVSDDGGVVGHVLYGLGTLGGGGSVEVPALAPLAVAVAWQGQGIGTALCVESLRRADAAGYPLVVVTGHPDYYPRVGFEPAMPLGVLPRDPSLFRDPRAFMVRRLSTFAGEEGTFLYSWER